MTDTQDQSWEEVEKLIDRFVKVDFAGKKRIDFNLKLDLLERTIERLRIRRKILKNNLRFEEFLQGHVFPDSDCLKYHLPKNYYDPGSGTPPIQLQPILLLFLLLYHKESYQVLDIIKHFIGKIWEQLAEIDFKKTETGVFRCFTNTRFAANKLRAYGLLKFTRKEAYKTWVLSLPGFLVASLVLEKYQNQWKLPEHRKSFNLDLHEDIWRAWDSMKTYDAYLRRLTVICTPNSDIFTTFDPALKKAYGLLEEYRKVLKDHKMTIAERHKESIKLLKRIEDLPSIDQFYRELSKSINLDRLLSET